MSLALALVCAAGAAVRVAWTGDVAVLSKQATTSSKPGLVTVDDDSLSEAAANTAANDPFRLVNHPSTVRYDARTEGGFAAPSAMFVPQRPQLMLRAIVGGPPWQAIVDGLPNQQPGTIVRTGSVFEKLTVRAVGRDTVTIQSPDTTWKLTLMRDRQ